MNSTVPSFSSAPVVGILPRFIYDPFGTFERARSAGNLNRLDLKFFDIIAIHNPETASHVLRENQRNYEKGGPFWSSVSMLIGEGLPVSNGELWRRQRRMMQPQFSRTRLEGLAPLVVEALEESLAWPDVTNSWQVLPIGDRMPHLAMNVVSATILGKRTSTSEAEVVTRNMDYAVQHLFRAMLTNELPRWLPIPGRKRFQEVVTELQQSMTALIEERRLRPARGSDDLLSMLVEAIDDETKEGMTSTQIRDEAMSLFLAGHETTATGLQWSLHFLGTHPEHLGRLREEVDKALGEAPPNFADLPKLGYARWIMQESLRLYPPIWWLPRVAVADDEIEGHSIPAGARIAPITYTIQRHPDFWSNANEFDPERFDTARSAGRHPLAWLPFGAGPRKCIGESLSMLESQLALAMLVQRYDIETPAHDPMPPALSAVIRPKHSIMLRIRRRRGS